MKTHKFYSTENFDYECWFLKFENNIIRVCGRLTRPAYDTNTVLAMLLDPLIYNAFNISFNFQNGCRCSLQVRDIHNKPYIFRKLMTGATSYHIPHKWIKPGSALLWLLRLICFWAFFKVGILQFVTMATYFQVLKSFYVVLEDI